MIMQFVLISIYFTLSLILLDLVPPPPLVLSMSILSQISVLLSLLCFSFFLSVLPLRVIIFNSSPVIRASEQLSLLF